MCGINLFQDASSGKTSMMQLNLVLLFFVGFGLGLGIGSLFSYQCSLLSENRTTLGMFLMAYKLHDIFSFYFIIIKNANFIFLDKDHVVSGEQGLG